MYSIDEVASAIFITLIVATFLLNTGRSLKAIELCKDCLIFLNDKGQGMQEELAKIVYCGIYCTMFRAYCTTADYTNAINYGNEVLLLSPERASVVIQIAEIYQRQNRHIEAKERYEKAINIMVKIGDRKGEADVYGRFGTLLFHLGEFDNAKEYTEKALAITIEIGDRNGEATNYGNLGTVFQSLGEYLKAKEYLEKALVIRKAIGDRKGEAACYGKLGTVFQSLGLRNI